jgi:hypothetical protein
MGKWCSGWGLRWTHTLILQLNLAHSASKLPTRRISQARPPKSMLLLSKTMHISMLHNALSLNPRPKYLFYSPFHSTLPPPASPPPPIPTPALATRQPLLPSHLRPIAVAEDSSPNIDIVAAAAAAVQA